MNNTRQRFLSAPNSFLVLALTIALVLGAVMPPLHAQGASREKISHQRIGSMLERVGNSAFDVFGSFPQEWECKAKSQEWIDSFDAKTKRAFGNGFIRVAAGPAGWKLTAEGVRQNELGFNLALAVFQLKIWADLAALQAYLPAATAALVATVVATPLTHEPALVRDDDVRRILLTARGAEHGLREISFDLGPEHDLRGARVVSKDGGELDLEVRNDRPGWSGGRWVVSDVRASHHRANGSAEVLELSWELGPVAGTTGPILPRRLRVARLDAAGKPLRDRPNDLNPWSLELWDCSAP